MTTASDRLSRLVAGALVFLLTAAPVFSLALPEGRDRNERTRSPAALGAHPWSAGGAGQPDSAVGYQLASYTPSADTVAGSAARSDSAGLSDGAASSSYGAFPAGAALRPRQTHEGPEVFTLDVPMNGLLSYYLSYYTSPEGIQWLGYVLARARPFLDFIAERIQHYHMPPELAFLPIVESTFNPYAVSYTGAAGLWQLMTNSIDPATMRINEWEDDRFDFWKATNASLEKLEYNYQVLGDWLLALAAYNSGLGTMIYLIQKTGIHDFWTLAADGYLPYETKQYVPKFLAVAAVASYAGRYGIPLDWDPPVQWERIRLDQAVDLRILAREAGVDLPKLLEGNAELRYDITPPPGGFPYYLKVPKQEAPDIAATLKDQRFKLMRFYIYRVGSGDTLYDLARYYGVPVSMILQYNPSVQARFLQIGTRLVIPGVKDVPPYKRPAASQVAAARPHGPIGPFTGTYRVETGDTLWSIAQRYSTTPEALASANGIPVTGVLGIGTTLKVPQTSGLLEASMP